MNKLVVINLGGSDLHQGFSHITAQLWTPEHTLPEKISGGLPAAPYLVERYRDWQLLYSSLCDRNVLRSVPADAEDELEINPSGVTNVSQQSFDDLSTQLVTQFNEWLHSPSFLDIERVLRSHLSPTDEVRIIIEASDPWLQRLPWQAWSLLKTYPKATIDLSKPAYQRRPTDPQPMRSHIRILAVLADSQGIDVTREREFLNSLPDAETHILTAPGRQELNAQLWDKTGWDILFFAGHSRTEGQTGRIYLRDQPTPQSLTIEQLEAALGTAIEHGLQLAIFNSCDGLGLALALEGLHLPTIIVMREPVPNQVVQEFFHHFLQAFAVERLSLSRAVHQARRQLQGLEDEFPGASWLPMLVQNPAVEPPTWNKLGALPACPYQGLFAFREADAAVFFGRESFTQTLLTAVQKQSLVAILGPSGSGKSSVVFAGLVPQLRSALSPTPTICSFRPGKYPFEALAKALVSCLPGVCQGTSNDASGEAELELAQALQDGDRQLTDLIDTIGQHHDRAHFILIADQFEELYTLCPPEDRQRFLDSVLYAVHHASAFTLLLTLRADFYGAALSYRPFSDRLQGSVYNLAPMNREELRAAIERPAAYQQVQIESGLTDTLIQSIWNHPGQLPLLEFALTELWAKQQRGWLTHAAYEDIGGVELALANYAERVYTQLDKADRLHMQRIFMQLVCPGQGTEDTRRLATKAELGEANWALVKKLADARLVVTNLDVTQQQETVEIVHEALIRNWGQLRQWLETDREFRVWQDRLRGSIYQWESSHQDEGALLRGAPLSAAEEMLTTRRDDLSAAEQAFIQRSLDLRNRQRQKEKQRLTLLRSLLGVTSAVAVVAVAAGLVAFRQSRIAAQEAQRAEAARQEEQRQTQLATTAQQRAENQEAMALSQYSQVLYNWNKDRIDSLVEGIRAGIALKQVSKVDPDTATQVRIALQQAVYGVSEQNRLKGHNGGVQAVAFSPANPAAANGNGPIMATAGRDNTVKLWKTNGQHLLTLNGHQNVVWSISFSPDGQTLASASRDRTARLWNLKGEELQVLQGHQGDIYSISFSPNGQRIATASQDNTIKLWDRQGNLLQTLNGHTDQVYGVAFSPDGAMLASASGDGTVKLWSPEGREIRTLQGHGGAVHAVAFSPDGQELATASADKTIKLWSPDGQEIRTLTGHKDMVWSVSYSPDGRTLASVGRVNEVKLWDRDGQERQSLRGHDANGDVWGLSFSPDSKLLATAGRDATVKLWSLNQQTPSGIRDIQIIRGHKGLVEQVEFSSDGQLMASASWDRTIKLWNLKGEEVRSFQGHTDDIWDVSFNPAIATSDENGPILASTGRDRTIKLWNLKGEVIRNIQGHTDGIEIVAISPDGQTLATASWDNTVKLWDLPGQELQTLRGHTATVESVAFSPDGQMLVTGSWDKTARLWNLQGQELTTLTGHTAAVESVKFSPDGQTVITTAWDNTARLWNLEGEELQTLEGHSNWVRDADFNPDGDLLATASVDQTVRLWKKLSNGDFQLLKILWAHGASVNGVDFSPDGRYLVSSDSSGSLILGPVELDATLDDLLKKGCDWVRDYLKNSPDVSEADRQLCDGI
jgi:WD40 repeat protein/energy-coupling factor transporter ATP-binding protein EcfA2